MFTYVHLHTPTSPFSPSLISLVVSVDVKQIVYLLTPNADLPESKSPALFPLVRVVSSLGNSYWLVLIFRSGKSLVLLTMQRA